MGAWPGRNYHEHRGPGTCLVIFGQMLTKHRPNLAGPACPQFRGANFLEDFPPEAACPRNPRFAGQEPPEAALAADKTSVVSAAKTSVVSAAKKAATAATSAATSDISI